MAENEGPRFVVDNAGSADPSDFPWQVRDTAVDGGDPCVCRCATEQNAVVIAEALNQMLT
jgi:hypothetical protein